jgi:hypothetical protein
MATSITSSYVGPDSQNVVTFTIGVGDTVRLCPPVNYLPVSFPEDPEKYDPNYFLNGFIVLDHSLGKLSVATGSNMCVYYTHNKSGRQIIQYCSDSLGLRNFYAILEGVVVHKHDSIAQGGPAFATYWSGLAPEE